MFIIVFPSIRIILVIVQNDKQNASLMNMSHCFLIDKNNIIQMLGKILSHQGYTSPVNPNQDILNNIAKNFTAIKCVSSSSPVSTQFTDQVPSIVKGK